MFNKKIKIFDLIMVVLSAIAFILECIPNSIVTTIRTGGERFITISHSYLTDPYHDFTTLVVLISTILIIITGIIAMLKNSKGLRIFNIVVSALAFFASIDLIVFETIKTAYEIVIAIIFFIQTVLRFALFDKSNQAVNKKVAIFNYLNVSALGLALVFQLVPTSLHILEKFNIGNIRYSRLDYAYFHPTISFITSSSNWMEMFGRMIALFTLVMIMCSFITLTKDNKKFCITQLVISSICEVFNVILLIMAGKSMTPYNVVIALLLIAPIVIQSIKLKKFYKVTILE